MAGQSLTEGRNGLLIPQIEIPSDANGSDFARRFFHDLWQANGYPVSYDANYSHELVVPATTDKPLVSIRGSYEPTSKENRGAQVGRISHSYGGPYDKPRITDEDITLGTERHSILLPPTDGSLQWGKFVWYSLLRDAGHNNDPIVTLDPESEHELYEETRGKDSDERQAIRNRALNSHFRRFVELVS